MGIRTKSYFILLEVMIVFSILTLVGGLFGWTLHRKIISKRLLVNVEKLHSRLQFCRQLALNCQSDWRAELVGDGKKWKLVSYSVDDPKHPGSLSLTLEGFKISLNGEKTTAVAFEFTASGDISPKGSLLFEGPTLVEWQLPDLFFVHVSS